MYMYLYVTRSFCLLQVLQTVYFAVAVLNDLFGTNVKPWENQETRSGLQKARDYILSSMAFPMGTVSQVKWFDSGEVGGSGNFSVLLIFQNISDCGKVEVCGNEILEWSGNGRENEMTNLREH